METRDGSRDVTATPADVSDRHHRSNGRGVVCLRWQNALQHRQRSAVHSEANLLRLEQFYLPSQASKRPRSSAAAKRGRGSVPTGSKRRLEEKKMVATWRTRY